MQSIEEKATTMPVVLKPSMGKNYTLIDGLAHRPIKTYFPIKGKISTVNLAKAYATAKAIDGLKGMAQDSPPLLYIEIEIDDPRYAELATKVVLATQMDFTFDSDNGPGVINSRPVYGEYDAEGNIKAANSVAPEAGQSFFDPSTNAVVRAFETTRGKGLAGMISSMKFTWMDSNNTWEVTRGSRAPTWCKVAISMDIIHDLPLGMSHDGFMIAPAYPVGNVNRRFFGTPYTSPTQEYDIPVVDNEYVKTAAKDPSPLDQSTQSPAAAAAAAVTGV